MLGWKQLAQYDLPDLAVRLVLALALLVLDDAALLVQLVLRDRAQEVAHPVRLEPQHRVQRVLRHVLEIVRAVEPGRRVQAGRAELFEERQVLVVKIFRTLKHQMLEQVSEPGAARHLVFRADVIPHINRYDRCLPVFVDDQRQTVVQHELLVGDFEFVGVRRAGRHQTCAQPGEVDDLNDKSFGLAHAG